MPGGAVDTRIVQMQFDNKHFEKNVKKSEKTLEKFKEHLDFSKVEKGLNTLHKATEQLEFKNVAENIQKLTDKFTGLGTVSELVLSQIRRGIENTARSISSMVHQLGFQQISEGKAKFESMNKSVQSIIAATGEAESTVYDVMSRLNKYTDQTSYDFADMAANIGKFTSAGIGLKDAEKEMEGIANWAARSGSGIQEASRAMYNLSQAMGVGKMTAIDWKSIENANMATKEFKEQLIQAGVASGNLEAKQKKMADGTVKTIYMTSKKLGKQVEVNYQNLRNTLNKGWADRKVMEQTLLSYYYEDLYYEGQDISKKVLDLNAETLKENEKLFQDGKIDLKEYVGLEKKGFMTKEAKQAMMDIAVQYGKLVKETDKNGKEIYAVMDKNGKKIEVSIDAFSASLKYGWLDRNVAMRVGLLQDLGLESYKAAQKCTTLTDVFNAWKDQLSTGWMKFWQHLFGNLSESMELFSNICNKVGESFDHFMKVLVGDGDKMKGIFGSFADNGGRLSLWSMFIGEYDGAYEGAYGFIDVLHDIGKLISDAFWELMYVMNPELAGAGMSKESWMEDEIYRTEYLGMTMREGLDKVRNFIQGIRNFFDAVPAGQTKSRFKQIQDVVTGALSVATIVYQSIQDIIAFITTITDEKHLGPAIDNIIAIFAMLANELTKVSGETAKGNGLAYFLSGLLDVLGNKDEGLIHSFNEFIGFIKDLIGWLIGANSEESRTIKLWQLLADFWLKKMKRVALVINHIIVPIIGFFKDLLTAGKDLANGSLDFAGFAERVKQAMKTAINSIFSFTPDFTGKVKQIFTDIKNLFTSGFSKESVDQLSTDVGNLFGDLKKTIPQGVKNALKTVYTSVKTFVANAFTQIKDFFTPFVEDVKGVFVNGFSKESLDKLKTRFQIIFQSISNAIPTGIKESFKGVVNKVKNFIQQKWRDIFFEFRYGYKNGKLQSWYEPKSFKQLFASISNAIPQGLKDGFKGTIERIGKIFSDLWNKIKDKITSIFTKKNAAGNQNGGLISEAVSEVIGEDPDKDSIFSKVITWIKEGFTKLKEYVASLFAGTKIAEVAEKVDRFVRSILNPYEFGYGNAPPTALEQAVAALSSGFEKVKEFIKKIASSFQTEGDTLWEAIKKLDLSNIALLIIGALGVVGLIKIVKKILGTVDSLMSIAKNISALPKNINEALHGTPRTETAGEKFLKYAEAIALITASLVVVGNMPLEKALQGIVVVGLIVFGLSKAMAQMKKEFSNMSDKDIMALRSSIFGILALAVSIWLVARAMYKIGNMPTDKWIQALLGFAGIIAAFCIVSKTLKDSPGFQWENMSGLLALAGSLLIVALSLAVLALIPFRQLIKAIVAVGVLLLLLYAMVEAMNGEKSKLTMANKGMKELAFLAAAVALLALSLVPLAMLPILSLIKAMSAVGILLLMLYAFVRGIDEHARSMKMTGMAQLLAVVGAVVILVTAMIPLSLMRFDRMLQALLGIGIIMALLLVFVVLINRSAATTMKGTGMIQLLAVAFAIQMLVLAMIPIALMKPEHYRQGIEGVIWLVTALLAFVVLVNATSGQTKLKGMASLIAVAGAIMMLVIAMIPLTLMNATQFEQGMQGMLRLMAYLAIFVALVGEFGGNVKPAAMVSLLAVAGSIVILVLAMIPLSMMPYSQLEQAVNAILKIMIGMVFIVLALSSMKPDSKNAAASAIMLAVLAGAIYVFSIAINKVKNVKPEVINAFAKGIIYLMAGLAAVMLVLSIIKNPTALIATMLIFVVGLAAVLGVVALMIPLIMNAIGSGLESMMTKMSLVAGMFANFMDGMNQVSENDLEAAKRKFQLLMDIVVSLADSGSYENAINSFENSMLRLGNAIDTFEFATSTVGNPDDNNGIRFLKKILDFKDDFRAFSIGSFNTDITLLGEALGHFVTATSGITEEPMAFTLLKNLADQADNLTKLATVPLDQLKTNIAGLGGALAVYATGASEATGLESADLPDIQKAVSVMQEVMTQLNGEDGKLVLPELPSETNLASFGTELAALAAALIQFEGASKDLGDTTKALEVLGFLNEIRSKIKKEDAEVAEIFSSAGITQDRLTNFGLEIEALGTSLKKFTDTTKNFDKNQNVEDALNFFAGLKERLIEADLKATIYFFDDQDIKTDALTEFGNDIGELGIALSKFANNVNFDDAKAKKFGNAIEAMDTIAGIAEGLAKIGKVGGVIGWFEGNVQTLGTMAHDLEQVGVALSQMSNALTGEASGFGKFDYELVTQALSALDGVLAIANALSATKGIEGAYDGYRDLTDLAVFISRFTNGEYWKHGTEVEVGNLESSKTIIDYFVDMMVALRDASREAGGFSDLSAFDAFAKMAQGIAALVEIDPTLDFTKVGENISKGIKKGIYNYESEVINAVIELVRETILAAKKEAKVKSPSRVFAQIGGFLSLGLAKGIMDKSRDPVISAQKLIDATANSARETAKVKSPSRVFAEIGNFLGLGLAVGLNDTVGIVTSASEDMAMSTINAMREALGIHSPSEETQKVGFYMAEGFNVAMQQSEKSVEKSASELADAAFAPFENGSFDLGMLQIKKDAGLLSDRDLERLKENVEAQMDEAGSVVGPSFASATEGSMAKLRESNQTKPFFSSWLDSILNNPVLLKAKEYFRKFENEFITPMGNLPELIRQDFAEPIETPEFLNQLKDPSEYWFSGMSSKEFAQKMTSFTASALAEFGKNTFDLLNFPSKGLQFWLYPEIVGSDDNNKEEIRKTLAKTLFGDEHYGENNDAEEFTVRTRLRMDLLDKFDYQQLQSVLPFLEYLMGDFMNNDTMTENFNVTPVLDMTKLQEGAGRLYGLFADPISSIWPFGNGVFSLDTSSANLNANVSMPENTTKPMNEIRDEVAELRTDMNAFAGALTNMKFVLNTGEVVAAIGPQMDEYLGQQGYYAARAEIP